MKNLEEMEIFDNKSNENRANYVKERENYDKISHRIKQIWITLLILKSQLKKFLKLYSV